MACNCNIPGLGSAEDLCCVLYVELSTTTLYSTLYVSCLPLCNSLLINAKKDCVPPPISRVAADANSTEGLKKMYQTEYTNTVG